MHSTSRRNAAVLALCVFAGASAFSPDIEYSIAATNDVMPTATPTATTPMTIATATASPQNSPTPDASSPSASSPGVSPEIPPSTPLDTSEIDPKAQEALQQMAAAYANLKSLSLNINLAGSPEVPRADVAVNWQKPNRFAIEIIRATTRMRTISDGKTLYRTNSAQPKQYLKIPVPAQVQNLQSAMFGAGAGDLIFSTLDSMISSMRAPMLRSLKISDGETPDTQIVTAIGGLDRDKTSYQFTFVIGKNDHFLRQIKARVMRDGKAIEGAETYSNLRVNPLLPASTFAFTPAKGATQIVLPTAPLNHDARLKVGAAPFAFQAKATNGQTVSIAKYKGRVLLLDFWATWCAPCIQQMPSLKTTYAKYHGKGFDILGISLDLEPSALSNYIKAQKIAWPQVYDTASKGKIAELYGVRAIPLAVLIGRDGKVVAINAQDDALDSAIKKALARK